MEICNTRVQVAYTTEAQINCKGRCRDSKDDFQQERHLAGSQGKSPEEMTFKTDLEEF